MSKPWRLLLHVMFYGISMSKPCKSVTHACPSLQGDVLLHIHAQALKVVFEMIYSAHMAFHMHVQACKAVTTFDISNIYGHEATALLIIFSSEMSLCGLNVQVCVATSSQPICSNCVL